MGITCPFSLSLSLQAQECCRHFQRKTHTGGTQTWCEYLSEYVDFTSAAGVMCRAQIFVYHFSGLSHIALVMSGVEPHQKLIRVRLFFYLSISRHDFVSFCHNRSFIGLTCTDDYAFMGSLIIKEVVKDLLSKGLDNAKILLLAGSR